MRVLAIDDDTDVLRLLQIKLGKDGHDVTTAGDGSTAAQILEQDRVELVVLEVELSGMSGLEVVRAVKAQPAPPLVIVLSHRGSDDDIAAGLAAGADDYLLKPFSPRVLAERIRVATIRQA